MHASELYELTEWIETNIKTQKVQQKYQALHSALQKITQPNEPRQPFEEQKNELTKALAAVPLHSLNNEQRGLLNEIKLGRGVGSDAIAELEDILFRNAIDPATAMQRVGEMMQRISYGVTKSDEIRTGLRGLSVVEKIDGVQEDEAPVRVTFRDKVAISNVVELQNQTKAWADIAYHIARACNSTAEKVRVVSASKGSIVFDLAVDPCVAQVFTAIMVGSLFATEKYLKILKEAEVVRNLKLQNKKLAKELEKEAEAEKKSSVDAIESMVVEKIGKATFKDGDALNFLRAGIKGILDFTADGGRIECLISASHGKDSQGEAQLEWEKLRKENEIMREQLDKVKLLEAEIASERDSRETGKPNSDAPESGD